VRSGPDVSTDEGYRGRPVLSYTADKVEMTDDHANSDQVIR